MEGGCRARGERFVFEFFEGVGRGGAREEIVVCARDGGYGLEFVGGSHCVERLVQVVVGKIGGSIRE